LTLVPGSAWRAIDVFLQGPEGLEVSAPEAHGYEFQSRGVVENAARLLEKLLDEFIAERTKSEKEEVNGSHAFDKLMQDLTCLDDLKDTSEGDLRDKPDTRDADQKCLDDLVTACERNASDCESRQQLRTDEI
jgi:hypothetical protein